MKWYTILKKFSNTKTVLSIVSLVVLIITTWGITLPTEEIEVTVQSICSILVLVGIMSNPTPTKGDTEKKE